MRRRYTFLLSALALLVLAGCSKTEPETARAEAPAPPKAFAAQPAPQDDLRPKIVAFGDSLTAGFGADPGESYPDYLQRLLDRDKHAYRLVNMGVSGDTTNGGLARVDAALARKPEIVIVELGGNDGLRGVPPAETEANLDRIVGRFKASGAKVLLAGITLPPNYGADYIRRFEATYKNVAAKHKVPLLPFLFVDIWDKPGMLQTDGIHATPQGNRIVAQTVYKALQPLL